MKDLTHIIYAARFDHVGGLPEQVDVNTAMLANLLDAVEGKAPDLCHVHLVHGSKYYGHTLAPSAEPFREDMPRRELESFYYLQQDYLEQRLRGSKCEWSVSRPHSFCDLSAEESRSITLGVAVYASILREQGMPLYFPGTPQSYAAKTQFTWLPLLADAILWMGTTPACANQAFNIVNDDPIRWSELWPLIAAHFGMEPGGPRSTRLVDFVADKEEIWKRVVARGCLKAPRSLGTLVQWAYVDYVFSVQWDVVSSMAKARAFGFMSRVDTRTMWRESLDYLASQKRVPPGQAC
jgi:nucleoside-diphosphate-sugar epimerase